MSVSVLPLSFEGREVRVVSRDGAPWWVMSDVCAVLEIRNPRDAADRLDGDEKGVVITDTLGGPQEATIINESGLYSLVLTSRKAAAKRFKKWITSEVIPSIRRTGGYVLAGSGDTPSEIATRALLVAEEAIKLQGEALDALTPKALAYDRLTRRDGAVSLTEGAKTFSWGRDRFIAGLHAHRWIWRSRPGKPWLAHADKERSGLLVHRTADIPDNDGRLVARTQVLVTERGLARLAAILPEWEAVSC
ncbi:MAG: BRO family protein [Acetobacter aceti]